MGLGLSIIHFKISEKIPWDIIYHSYEISMPRLGRGTREWKKIPPRPPLAKGGWGDLKIIF